MSEMGPVLQEATQRIQDAEAMTELVEQQGLKNAVLETLRDLSRASALIEDTVRSLAVYAAEEIKVSRTEVASTLNYSTGTLHSWVVAHRKATDGTDGKRPKQGGDTPSK